jgi:hypothetical protein
VGALSLLSRGRWTPRSHPRRPRFRINLGG